MTTAVAFERRHSITEAGARYPNVGTSVGASDFQSNLEANGFKVGQGGLGANENVTVLRNELSETYTIYTRHSTEKVGAEFIGPNGEVKFSLGIP